MHIFLFNIQVRVHWKVFVLKFDKITNSLSVIVIINGDKIWREFDNKKILTFSPQL